MRYSPSYGSVSLEGSEKQISWAEDIRTEQMNKLDSYVKEGQKQAQEARLSADQMNQIQKNTDQAFDNLKMQTSASWWIENRSLSPEELFRKAYALKL